MDPAIMFLIIFSPVIVCGLGAVVESTSWWQHRAALRRIQRDAELKRAREIEGIEDDL